MTVLVRFTLAVALICGAVPTNASAWPPITAVSRIALVDRLLDETEIQTANLDEKLTIEKLLAVLSERRSNKSGLTIGFDRMALGDNTAKFGALQIRVRPWGTVSLRSVLQETIAQLPPGTELDYAVQPTGVVITRSRFAARTQTHDLRSALRVSKRLYFEKVDSPGPANSRQLIEFLVKQSGLRSWETVELLNRSRLAVFAVPSRHHSLGRLLDGLNRLADLGVYMNARLYEVDSEFYTTAIAPTVVRKDDEPAPVAVRVEGTLLDRICKQALVLESEETKLETDRKAVFLSRERMIGNTGVTGVTVAVRPEVSPDRRHLRLHLTQSVTELVNPARKKGPHEAAEEPSVRKKSISGTLEIRDGEAFLMPIDFRPSEIDRKGMVWVLVARPLIWIETEERERNSGFKPREIWNQTEFEELKRALIVRAKLLPATEEAKAILQSVLAHVLTSKEIADSRKFYGTESEKTVLMSNTGRWEWPDDFRPELHGYKLVTTRPGPFTPRANQNRVLGIRIDRFEPDAKTDGLFDAPIEVCIFNAGGTANGAVIGGCSLYYA